MSGRDCCMFGWMTKKEDFLAEKDRQNPLGILHPGEKWYVRLVPGACLTEREIVEVTEKTVLLKSTSTCAPFDTRYKYTDIEFVERFG